MSEDRAIVVATPVVVVVAPRGYGKSVRARRWAEEEHGVVILPGELLPVGVTRVALDGIDTRRPDHVDAVRELLAALRVGRISALLLASRSPALHLLVSETASCSSPRPEQLLLADTDIQQLALARGIPLGPGHSALVAQLSGRIPRLVSLAVDAVGFNGSGEEITARFRSWVVDDLRDLASTPAALLLLAGSHWDATGAAAALPGHPEALADAEAEGLLLPHSSTPLRTGILPYVNALRDLPLSPSAQELLPRIRRRHVASLLSRSLLSDAVQACILSDDPVLIRMVAIAAAEAVSYPNLTLLAESLRDRPGSRYSRDGLLRAIALVQGRGELHSEAGWQAAIDEVVDWPRPAPTTTTDRLLDQWVFSTVHRLRNDLDRAVDLASRSVAIWRTAQNREMFAGLAACTLTDASVTYTVAERYADAVHAGNEGARVALIVGHRDGAALHAAWLATAFALGGDIASARKVFTAGPAGALLSTPDTPLFFFGGLARALMAIEDADPDTALEALRTTRPLLEHGEHWWLLEALQARALDLQGPGRTGSTWFTATLTAGARSGRTITAPMLLTSQRLILAIQEGRIGSAHMMIRRDRHAGRERPAMQAALHLAERDAERALRAATRSHPLETPWAELLRLLVAATAAEQCGFRARALEFLTAAATGIQHWQLGSPLRLLPVDAHETLRGLSTELGHDLGTALDAMARRHPGFASSTAPSVRLTPGEERALHALNERDSVDGVAEALGVTRNTAKTHLRTLYRKLGASTRAEALDAAAAVGFIDSWHG